MEPLTPETAKLQYSIGKPESKGKDSGRLYIILNGETLNIRGIKITSSKQWAKVVNFFGYLWTNMKNILPGQKVLVRRKYVPITIVGKDGHRQVVYANLNSLFKHLALFRGKRREQELRDRIGDDSAVNLTEALEGDSTLDPVDQGSYVSNLILFYAVFYYNRHRTADTRLAAVERFFKRPVTEEILSESYLNIKDYDPHTSPVYRPEKHQRTKQYVELSDLRMRLSGTISGQQRAGYFAEEEQKVAEEEQKVTEEEQKIATRNWAEADNLVARWAIDRGKRALEVSDILEIHRILGQDLKNNGYPAGVMRGPGEEVQSSGGKNYIAGKHVEGEMKKYIIWLKSQLHECDRNPHLAVKTAAEAYHRLVSIHPFPDANGRTARMVMDYILQRYGLPPAALTNAKAGIFGDLPDEKNIPLSKIILQVRDGVAGSCGILGLKSPFSPLVADT